MELIVHRGLDTSRTLCEPASDGCVVRFNERRGTVSAHNLLGVRSSIQRGALAAGSTDRADELPHLIGPQLLTVSGASRPADGFVHERAAQVIGPRLQATLRPLRAELYPRCLHVPNNWMQYEARDCMHQQCLAQRRPLASSTPQIHGRFHVHEWQRHELSESAGILLKLS
jgi:hypothetical protein